MQRIRGLRSLIALQVFFTHTADTCNSMLRELRCCAIDNIVHCPTLLVEYVAICYTMKASGPTSNSVTLMKRKPHGAERRSATRRQIHLNMSTECDGKGKGKANSTSLVSDEGSLSPSSDSVWTPDDSEDEDERPQEGNLWVKTGLKLKDVTGIKMWEKEIWDLRL
ncbi:hypothetical protein VTN02DRAFT_5395 [Thermoascus thermophilus]